MSGQPVERGLIADEEGLLINFNVVSPRDDLKWMINKPEPSAFLRALHGE